MITIGLDVETTAIPNFRPWQPEAFLVSVGMAWEDGRTKAWVLQHAEYQPPSQRAVLDEIQAEIDQVDRIVGHNLKFDLQWLWSVGIKTDHLRCYCTQVAEYLLMGQDPVGYSLDETSQRYDIPDKIDRIKVYWNAGYKTEEIPLRHLLPYQEQDCVNTLAIFKRQLPKICEWRMEGLVHLQMHLMQLLARMEANGARVDLEAGEAIAAKFVGMQRECEAELRALLGREDLNLGSGDELSAALYGGVIKREREVPFITTRGVKYREPYVYHYKDPAKPPVVKYRTRLLPELVVKKRTEVGLIELPQIFEPLPNTEVAKPGYWKTDKNTLKQLRAKTPEQKKVLALLADLSMTGKVAETLRGKGDDSGILDKVTPDGCLHTNFNQTRTRTGRLSSSSPNLQNQPRSGTSPIKTIFVPRYDLIGNGDLSQLEWRVAAWMSQDPVAIDEIVHDVDYHRDNAIRFFGADPSLLNDHPKFKPLRTAAKVFGFRLLQMEPSRGDPCRITV